MEECGVGSVVVCTETEPRPHFLDTLPAGPAYGRAGIVKRPRRLAVRLIDR